MSVPVLAMPDHTEEGCLYLCVISVLEYLIHKVVVFLSV